MAGKKILVVEDDANLLNVLKYNLVKEGYTAIVAADGQQAVHLARSEKPDLVILDLMLPKMDGLEVCRIIRKEMTVPIMMLTAKAEEIDKIVGLEVGADDYMTKPFSLRELLARVHALLRRSEMIKQNSDKGEDATPEALAAGQIGIDFARHAVTNAGVLVELNPREFDLLAFLVRNRGQVFSREALLSRVWGYDYAGDTRTVDVHIRWLRQKIEKDPENPHNLVTVRGVGYKFEEQDVP